VNSRQTSPLSEMLATAFLIVCLVGSNLAVLRGATTEQIPATPSSA